MIMFAGVFYQPCGACVDMVPVASGCPHWRPNQKVRTAKSRTRRQEQAEQLAEFRRQMNLGAT